MTTTLRNADKTFRSHLEGLGADKAPEARLALVCDAVDTLEALLEEARRLRAGTVIDLRLPKLGLKEHSARITKGLTWPAIAELSGRPITPQAVEQWARHYKADEVGK